MDKTDPTVAAPYSISQALEDHSPEAAFDINELRSRRQARRRLSLAALALDLSAITTAYIVASLLYFQTIMTDMIQGILLSIIPIFIFVSLNNNSYSMKALLVGSRSFWSAAASLVWASLALTLILFFLKISDDFSRILLALGTVLAVVLIAVSRLAISGFARSLFGQSSMAIICIYDGMKPRQDSLGANLTSDQLGVIPDPNDPVMLDRLGRLSLGIDGLVIHCPREKRARWAFMLKSLDVAGEIVTPEITELQPLAIRERSGQASLVIGSGKLSLSQHAIKRSFDVLATVLVLPFLTPLLFLIALAIKLDSRGPVLFRQERIGLGNRKFRIFKFRTMYADQMDSKGRRSTSRTDNRVTRVGGFLRRTSLDELPQLLNVLVGDMSIVGPRPHAEGTAVGSTMLWEIDAAYWHRHVVKPGITGLAQVRGHRGGLFEEGHLKERLNADLEYVANWSLTSDIKIILRTLSVLVHKNAY